MARQSNFTNIWRYFLVFVVSCVSATSNVPFDFQHVQVLTAESANELMQAPHISVIYFFKREIPRLRGFFRELDKSAEYLEIYGTKTAVLDCTDVGDKVSHCDGKRVEHSIYCFKGGSNLITLELETMFDVNSIMSNILQLVLLQEVPIVQTPSDRHQLELKNKGQSDIIFAYHKAIGTFEHRVFMEVAYAYQGQYKFGITTELRTLEGLADHHQIIPRTEAAIWVLYCREAKEEDTGCPSMMYRGRMDLPSMAMFLKALSLPAFFHMPKDGQVPPCVKEKIACIYLYYETTTKEIIMEAAEGMKQFVHGVATIVLVEIEGLPQKDYKEFEGQTPALGVQKEGSEPIFMNTVWSLDSVAFFIEKTLFDQRMSDDRSDEAHPEDVVTERSRDMERAAYNFPTVEEVETQDDQVADAVFQMRHVKMNLKLVPALTDKTFPTVKDRDLVSVLFYLPFDSRSMAFLRAYGDASFSFESEKEALSPLVRINCFDWTDVCVEQNVTRYPVVRIFRKGRDPEDYKGALDTDAVVSAVKLMQMKSPIELKSVDDARAFVAGKIPENATTYTNMSVLGLFESKNLDFKGFIKVAETFQNITVFGYLLKDKAETVARMLGVTIPTFMVFRHDDTFTDPKSLTGELSALDMRNLVLSSRISTLPELTADIFPLIYAEDKPVLILFCDMDDEEITSNAKKVVADISSSKAFPGIIFTWMHARGNGIGANIFSTYTYNSALPALSVVYHRTGEVYNKAEHLTAKFITEWLNRVVTKQEDVAIMLNEGDWKPAGRGYDFLALTEYEHKYGTSAMHEEDHPSHEEDYGVGFPPDEVENGETGEEEFDKSLQELDEETRNELLALRNSRLYHQAMDRKKTEERMRPAENEDKMTSDGSRESEHPKHTEL